ncbi:hypothetical protein F5Y10DRAFT_289094 [Nemania abortiva]|nr:hypothetical protein F5Y10DRAFT_289094 [Nemania abortiva]
MIAYAHWSQAFWVRFIALSWCWSAVLSDITYDNVTFPVTATVEFDAVFPRNDTYAPVDLMPIVFAVQNSSAALSLGFSVLWELTTTKDGSLYVQDQGLIDLQLANYSSGDPYYALDYVNLKKAQGIYRMNWTLNAYYCPPSTSHPIPNNVTFTIKKGAKEPDLVASTSPDTCANIQGLSFDERGNERLSLCAELRDAANPCALNINEELASSISAKITSWACTPAYSMALWGVLATFHCNIQVFASFTNHGGRGPGYRGGITCPKRCSDAGSSSGNWSLYHNLDQLSDCPEALFYDFALLDPVDDPSTLHRLYACSAGGGDWTYLPSRNAVASAAQANGTYELGWWSAPPGPVARIVGGQNAITGARALSRQVRLYLTNGHAPTHRPALLFSQLDNTMLGVYVGAALQNEGTGATALQAFEDNLSSQLAKPLTYAAISAGGGVAMQLCTQGSDAEHIFGIVASTNGSFAAVQGALRSLSHAVCMSGFAGSINITASTYFITPQITSGLNSSSSGNTTANTTSPPPSRLGYRAECRTIQVVSGDSCASLASKCGISGSDFTKYNPQENLCSALVPYQHVCCSSGILPDFTPKPNSDGSCATYIVVNDDSCSAIAAANSLTVDDLESFNKNTWAWNGCNLLWVGTIICLSEGDPPMPAPVANAICGPQVPGTQTPPKGTDISTLNQCALNACCDVWGQCGTTSEFCTNTSTGAPGTAMPGTNGCISNCGTNIVFSGAPEVFRSVTYFEGYNLGRTCLYMDAHQIDTSKYTHVHYGFATLSDDFQVLTGDEIGTYDTYYIFREAVTAANRLRVATNIANFINHNDLDGVDFDWEYPGAPDIPGIPPGTKDDGTNYLAFLVVLRNLLGPDKSISVAAASSYWYLKGYPIADIAKVVDYIIFLTYDLHGQWDAGNAYTNPGCPTGNCLRSGVNLTETINSLSLITKAGVPSNKVVVGITSYGRSFQMLTPGCTTELCTFTGSNTNSDAAKGRCTGTAGYISNAEIKEIISDGSRVTTSYVDASSDTNILVYDDIQWVGYMDEEKKSTRRALYQFLQMGGTTDWAVDLESFQQTPANLTDWNTFVLQIKSGIDPFIQGTRTGNWTTLTCEDRAVVDLANLTPQERWGMLDCQTAWEDAVRVWKEFDRSRKDLYFSESIANTFHVFENTIGCINLASWGNCDQVALCEMHKGSGPAAYLVWNSLVTVHEIYHNFHNALFEAASTYLDPSFPAYEDAFTPLPMDDDTLLQVLLDFVGIFGAIGGAAYFNNFLRTLPSAVAFLGKDTVKDGSLALLAGGIAIAKDLVADGGKVEQWTPMKRDDFAAYMGQVVAAWGNVTEKTVGVLFNGTDSAIDALGNLIAGGRFIEGSGNGHIGDGGGDASDAELQYAITNAFWSYIIPLGWTLSGTHGFILDSGFDCNTEGNPLDKYLLDSTQSSTRYCYPDNNKLYYLVAAKGDAELCVNEGCANSYFQKPPGLDKLDGTAYGGLTLETLVAGSLKTFEANGNKNGAGPLDIGNSATVEELYDHNVTSPGYIRLPVCSAQLAFYNWDSVLGKDDDPKLLDPVYPCNTPKTEDLCGDSTFVDRTSDASPTVADCLQIAANIYIDGEWMVDSSGVQHQILEFGTCKFGIMADGLPIGNVQVYIGNQDVIDIIHQSVGLFGGSGKVGSKGDMTCQGNVKKQKVTWGLY